MQLITIQQAASQCAISPRMVRKLIAKAELPVVRIGRCVRLRVGDLDALVRRGYSGFQFSKGVGSVIKNNAAPWLQPKRGKKGTTMQDSTTIREKAQSAKHGELSVTLDLYPRAHNSQPVLNPNIDGLTPIGSITHDALLLALQQTPSHKRAEAIEALAERGVWLAAKNGQSSLRMARA